MKVTPPLGQISHISFSRVQLLRNSQVYRNISPQPPLFVVRARKTPRRLILGVCYLIIFITAYGTALFHKNSVLHPAQHEIYLAAICCVPLSIIPYFPHRSSHMRVAAVTNAAGARNRYIFIEFSCSRERRLIGCIGFTWVHVKQSRA